MAARLCHKGGHKLKVFDISQKNVKRLIDECGDEQITVCTSPAAVAEDCNTVCTMLPSNPHVEQVYLDPDQGLLVGAKEY